MTAVTLAGPEGFTHGWVYHGQPGSLEHVAAIMKMADTVQPDSSTAATALRNVGRAVATRNLKSAAVHMKVARMADRTEARGFYRRDLAGVAASLKGIPAGVQPLPRAQEGAPSSLRAHPGSKNPGYYPDRATVAFTGHSPAVELVGPGGWSHGWIRDGGDPAKLGDIDAAGVEARHGKTAGDEIRAAAAAARAGDAAGAIRHSVAAHEAIASSMGAKRRGGESGAAQTSDRALLNTMRVQRQRLAGGGNADAAVQAGNDTEAVELTATMVRKVPMVRGAADVQMARSGPGMITVQHKSTGMKVGTLAATGKGWQAMHATGVKAPASGSQQGALAGLIAYHNKNVAGRPFPPAQQNGTATIGGSKTYTASGGVAVQLAASLPVSTPAASASDGPRVTTIGGASGGTGSGSSKGKGGSGKKKAAAAVGAAAGKLGLSAEGATVYAKLIKKGFKPGAALAFAKRAAAMAAKAKG